MNIPVQTGRVDLCLLAALQHIVQTHVDPNLPIPVWSDDVARAAVNAMYRAGVPNQPVTSLRLGNLDVPLGVVEWIFKACTAGGRE